MNKTLFSLRHPSLLRGGAILGLSMVSLLLGSCAIKDTVTYIFGRNHVMEGMKPLQSINVLPPPWWWPDEDSFNTKKGKIGILQKQYLEDHGKPDYLRLFYDKNGTVLGYNMISSRKGLPEPKGAGWIYLDRDIEVTFDESGFEENPITDEVQTLCEMGDPDEIRFVGKDPSIRHVRYVYRREGMFIDFLDYEKTNVQRVNPMPGWMRSSPL